ncbi:MAG: glycosyl transferase, partial [Sulfurimonas sp.]|nr:glycosyl transferase [Sulfurimonas sp.]
HCIIAPSATLIYKELFDRVGFFDESLEVCEDYDLWLRVACGNEIGLVDKTLITKYAGHEDQLSFKHWGMDKFRVLSLEKLLRCEFPSGTWELGKRDIVIDTLLQKYRVLLKGAIKYDRISDIKEYEEKIKYYE